jgi:hypothetical protein
MAAAGRDVLPSTIRDPFGYVTVARTPSPARAASHPKAPAPEPEPVLTAVVTDVGDTQAVIEYLGRSYTVRVGSTLGEHGEIKVISITDSGVLVEGNGKQLLLHLGSKGK